MRDGVSLGAVVVGIQTGEHHAARRGADGNVRVGMKKRVPSDASLSMFGVISSAAPPKQPGESQFMSSAIINRMLGRFTGAESRPQTSSPRTKKGTGNQPAERLGF